MQLDIAYDSFIRTTDARHEALVREVLERVWARGDIYAADYSGYYCVDCEEYKDEAEMDAGAACVAWRAQVVGGGGCGACKRERGATLTAGPHPPRRTPTPPPPPRAAADKQCPTHRKTCALRSEQNYFFALSKYQGALEELLTSRPEFVTPDSRRNEVLGWVRAGLRDFSISRAAVEWGIPVPRDPKQTVYVWFDALNGYLSGGPRAGGMWTGAGLPRSAGGQQVLTAPRPPFAWAGLLPEGAEPTPEALAAAGWPADLHLIGKDILRFHAVYWPAMLMAAGLPPPRAVFGHGFLTKDGLKMGKSLGNVLEPRALVQAYGADAVRYYFLREIAFGQVRRRGRVVCQPGRQLFGGSPLPPAHPPPSLPITCTTRRTATSARSASATSLTRGWPTTLAICSTARSTCSRRTAGGSCRRTRRPPRLTTHSARWHRPRRGRTCCSSH